MEPDLSRLVSVCGDGKIFPQFTDTWNQVFDAAQILENRLGRESRGTRLRLALRATDPESFCALLLAFSNREVDLFLFNPYWSEQELESANTIATPHWILGHGEEGKFREERVSKCFEGKRIAGNGIRIMIPTGGTSGKIRFAIHNGSTLLASVRAFQAFFGVEQICSHCLLPLYHVSGFMQIIRAIVSRGKVWFGDLSDFSNRFRVMESESPEGLFLSLVPTQLHRILERNSISFDSLKKYRAIFLGGGPAHRSLLRRGRELSIPLAPTYGMTETASMIATMKPEAFLAGESGQGFLLPHATIRIVPVDDFEINETGKGCIEVMSDSLFLGYFGEDRRRGEAFLTNDIGELGDRGALIVHGRRDRVIISGGEKINLQEIETAAMETGWVEEAVAFGVEDNEWGNRLCLAYVPKGCSIEDACLRNAVSGVLKGFKLPKRWLPLDSLPRNEAGKVLVGELRQRLVQCEGD